MRSSIREAISSTVNNLIDAGLGDKIMKEEYDLSTMKSRPTPYVQNSNFFPLGDGKENRISEGKAVFSDILKAKKDWES